MPSEPLTRGVIFSWTICVGLACQLLAGARGQDLFTCGWDEVRALRIVGTNITVLWKWTASNSNLPEWTWPLFATTDDCKPYGDGRVVITSSGGDSMNGGVAVVQVQTTQAVFYARAANAHSADLLPRDRIAVALSYQTNGNRLVVFDLSQPDTELFRTELRGGHGVVWDDQRQLLWALADYEIRAYLLVNWDTSNPQLQLVSRYALPGIGGHDMYPVPHSAELVVTTGSNCWLFDRDTRTFQKHPLLGDISSVKGVSVHPVTGQIVYVRGETQWWSDRLYFLEPAKVITLPGQRLYKARWIQPPQLTIEHAHGSNAVVLQWPLQSLGFELQGANVIQNGQWETVPGPFDYQSGNWHYVFAPQTDMRFFRLWPVLP